jgi:hypothetical protein
MGHRGEDWDREGQVVDLSLTSTMALEEKCQVLLSAELAAPTGVDGKGATAHIYRIDVIFRAPVSILSRKNMITL